jgi:hypothetical protein
MNAAMQEIWKVVSGLEQADVHSAAMCHSIIKMMINQGVITKEEFTRQIAKSTIEVVSVHKQIVKAMQEQKSAADADRGLKTLQ